MSTMTEADVRAALFHVTRSEAVKTWDVDFDFLKSSIDSLDHATLALELDEKYGLKISDEDLPRLRTISALLTHAATQGV